MGRWGRGRSGLARGPENSYKRGNLAWEEENATMRGGTAEGIVLGGDRGSGGSPAARKRERDSNVKDN